jgi:CheY-like chemotaxis protein
MSNTEKALIFFVEYDWQIRRLFARIFDRADRNGSLLAKIELFENPGDFLNRFEEAVPDVIVTDHDLPGMTGAALVRILRDREFFGGIIMVTGDPIEEPPVGVDRLMRKPFAPEEILAAVRERI